MGNKPNKPSKKFLFDQDIPFQPSNPESKKLEKPQFPIISSETIDPFLEFSKSLQFSSKAFIAFTIFEHQLELTQSNGLFLDYTQFIEKTANYGKNMDLLNHVQLIELHSHFEMKEFYSQFYDKINDISPIKKRNSKKHEENPLKKEFLTDKIMKNREKPFFSSEKQEKSGFLKEKAEFLKEKAREKATFSQEIEDKDCENTEEFEEKKKWFFLKPNFVHFSDVFPHKRPNSEEKLRNSIKKLNEKLKPKTQFLFDSRETIKEIPLLQLDLYKTSQKPSYLEISSQKPHILSRKSSFTEEITCLTCNLEEKPQGKSPFRAGKSTYNVKKPINKQKNKEKTQKKHENTENTKENLNKSALLRKKKSSNFEKSEIIENYANFEKNGKNENRGNYAENRGNFLYMKYEFPKKNLIKNENQKEILETSLINLKKSLNFARDSKKIYWKKPLQQKNDENSVDLKVSELEKLRKSLFSAKSLQFE